MKKGFLIEAFFIVQILINSLGRFYWFVVKVRLFQKTNAFIISLNGNKNGSSSDKYFLICNSSKKTHFFDILHNSIIRLCFFAPFLMHVPYLHHYYLRYVNVTCKSGFHVLYKSKKGKICKRQLEF